MERKRIMFGRNLKILRSKNGVSQQKLADEIHVTRQTVSLWERGQVSPDINYLHNICGVFDIPVEQMMYGTVLQERQCQANFSEIKEILQPIEDGGYIVAEIFDNGFSVGFLNDEEARHFHSDLYNIIDSFIHRDNEYIEERRAHYSDIMNSVRHDGIMEALGEIYGKLPEQFDFYWVDMEENLRGYADSEEECRNQARNQKCEKYKIFPQA